MKKSYSAQTAHVTVCHKLFFVFGVFSVHEELLPTLTALSSVVSDDDMHKLPASRDERADGGHGSESLRYTQCARPSAVRVTRGARAFTLLSFSDRGTTRNGSRRACQ